jgi:hypothetical protein
MQLHMHAGRGSPAGERRRQALISTCLCVLKTIRFIAPK